MATKSNTASTKRKADACDGVVADGGGKKPRAKDESSSPPLHLPAPVWGRVLDHMPYQEVRSALLVCKSIADEAVRYVHTLNIMRDSELDIPAARRFPNVQHVNVLCLIKENEHSRDWTDQTIFSCITARATVPFIQIFPRLSSIFVGGLVNGNRRLYSSYQCYGKKHVLLFRSLVSSFIGAYKTRALSQEISLSGVLEADSLYFISENCKSEREEGDLPDECRFCREACKYLPLKDCQYSFSEFGLVRCLKDETRECILRGRKGGMDIILRARYVRVIEAIDNNRLWHNLNHDIKVDRDLYEKLMELGLENDEEGDPQYISSEDLRNIDELVESFGIDPRDIPKDLLYERMRFGTDGRNWDVFCKSTIDSLIARGYPIDPADLIVVDEEQEPALQRIIRQERGPNRP